MLIIRKRNRKLKPLTIHDMAWRRGLCIHKAKYGGWFVTLAGLNGNVILYCTHSWNKVVDFVNKQRILVKRSEDR